MAVDDSSGSEEDSGSGPSQEGVGFGSPYVDEHLPEPIFSEQGASHYCLLVHSSWAAVKLMGC